MSETVKNGDCINKCDNYPNCKPCAENHKRNELRNYFAGKALQGLLANPKYFSCDDKMILEEKISKRAFSLADDMVNLSK